MRYTNPFTHSLTRRFGDVFRWLLYFIFWKSAIFLLPVCLTYWPRNYTTRVDPHVDNSHQVRSWYDYPLPSYSVFVWWYVTWPGDLDLLTLNSCHSWRVTCPTSPPSMKTLRLSVPSKWGPKMAVLGENGGVENLDFGFATPKRHFFAWNRVVWRILRQNRFTRLGCSLSQEQKNIAESL